MPVFITEEQAKARLTSPRNMMNRNRSNGPNNDDDQPVSIRPFFNQGRRDGDQNVPSELRQLAALTALDSTMRDAADLIGGSVRQVANYVKGEISPGIADPILKAVVETRMEKAQEIAIDKLLGSLNKIDFEDKEQMKKIDARGLSQIASNLSRVVEQTSAKTNTDDRTRLIIYAPEIKNETHYSTVEVYTE
jgi:hypothetical protein